MAFGGILMDYHIIFMLVCFALFFLSILFIWLIGTKQAVIVAVFFTCINQLFCILSMVGFYSIGYIGYNETTGETLVMGYTEMSMFNIMFLALLWMNSVIMFIAIFKYMRMVLQEQLGREYGYRDKFG
jgi:hypothetical protein